MTMLVQSGTKTCTSGGTEDDLGTAITAEGVYQLVLDQSAIQAGEFLYVRILSKVLSGGTARTFFYGVAPDDGVVSVPLPSDIYWHAKITQVSGTGRAIPWKFMNLRGA